MSNKVAIVAGGSSGIGLEIVRHLYADGYSVAFYGTSKISLAEVIKGQEASKLAARLKHAIIDVRQPQEIADFTADVRAQWGTISTLVYAAGISPKRDGVRVPIHEIDLGEWQDVLSINLTGALLACQALLPEMMENKFGRIVTIGSMAARTLPRYAGGSYVASKGGLGALTRAIATEYGPYGITCNNVAPGNIATKMMGDVGSPKIIDAMTRIPVGRIGMPEDIASMVAYLCRPEAGYINGATLDVTGGEFMNT